MTGSNTFTPEELPEGTLPFFNDTKNSSWTPVCLHPCAFRAEAFIEKMMNLIHNPNINSSWLFRADILFDDDVGAEGEAANETQEGNSGGTPWKAEIAGYERKRTLVRRLIPRNDRRDAPLNQTCHILQSSSNNTLSTLIIYLPHTSSPEDTPFYHPKVKGIAHLHEFNTSNNTGRVSIHFLPFPSHPLDQDPKLTRTAYHLLQVIHKHGTSSTTAEGYIKRVHHDLIVPQPRFQDRYGALKNKYARSLLKSWAEVTDPNKHVFEDLGIAAFLMELWKDMYADKGKAFPGFVDIGCGNGLLVCILNEEGYSGWGFDARERKSWAQYRTTSTASPTGSSLERKLLLPNVALPRSPGSESELIPSSDIHDGTFPPGTFIISNHADELTPWTPILAALPSDHPHPFIMIPCCSHALNGARYRAPPPRDKSKSKSTYASLVDWVARIAEDCGWNLETEMLRIPSTRNACLLGRTRKEGVGKVDIEEVVGKYGGVDGYFDNVVKLVKTAPKGH